MDEYQRQLSYLQVPTPYQEPLDPWLFDAPSCGSPTSTSSTIPSEGALTPAVTASLPAYHILEQPLLACHTASTSYPVPRNRGDNDWQQHYLETGTWNPQQCLPSHPSTGGYVVLPSSIGASTSSSFSFPTTMHQIVDSDAVKAEDNNDDLESLDENDSDSEVSDYNEDNSSPGRYARSTPKNRSTPGVHKLGKWQTALGSYDSQEARHYVCHFSGTSESKGRICHQRFQRPEHLRRHQNSVHSGKKPFGCQIPGCRTKFNRGDNLREHYWTHLQRGGRKGKNDKYSFQELRAMLGPKDKKLVRRLKEKLIKYRSEQKATQHRKNVQQTIDLHGNCSDGTPGNGVIPTGPLPPIMARL